MHPVEVGGGTCVCPMEARGGEQAASRGQNQECCLQAQPMSVRPNCGDSVGGVHEGGQDTGRLNSGQSQA